MSLSDSRPLPTAFGASAPLNFSQNFLSTYVCSHRPLAKRRPARLPCTASLNYGISDYVSARRISELEWRQQNTSIVKAANEDGPEAAVEVLRELEHEGKAVRQNYNQLVSVLISRKKFEKGLEIAIRAGRRGLANIITFRPLMKYCCANGLGKGAKRVWRAMVDSGVDGDMFLYAELMGALVRAQDLASAQKVLSGIHESGRKPHIVLYNTLLKGFAKKANVRKAFEILQTIEQSSIKPDETTFNTILNTCVRARDAASLSRAMSLMRKSKIKPGVATFNTLLKLYTRAGEFKDALDIFEEMQQTVEPSIVTFNTMIDGCAHRGDMDQAIKFFDEMIDRGMSPDICTMTSLLKGFGRARSPQRAVELYEAMQEGGYKIEDRTRYAVINACLRSGDRENARRLMIQMVDNGCTIRPRTWSWMLECDVWADDEKSAVDLLTIMRETNSPIDTESKLSVLKEMRERGGFLRATQLLTDIRAVDCKNVQQVRR